MTRTYQLMSFACACAALAGCGPGKPEPSDTTGTGSTTGDASSTTAGATSTAPTTAPTTTGSAIEKCADARTEAECMLATEVDPNSTEAGCRWGEVRVAVFPKEGMCMLTVVGGVCQLATFDEGGPGCFGFFRETESGAVELVSFDCGSPVGGEWEPCWDVAMDSPGLMSCTCLNPEP